MKAPTFNEIVGGALAFVGVAVVGYLAVMQDSEQAEGALIALLAAAVGWLYRGKVQNPEEGQVSVTTIANPPATATVNMRETPPPPEGRGEP